MSQGNRWFEVILPTAPIWNVPMPRLEDIRLIASGDLAAAWECRAAGCDDRFSLIENHFPPKASFSSSRDLKSSTSHTI